MKKYSFWYLFMLISLFYLFMAEVNAATELKVPVLSQRVTDLSRILTSDQHLQLENQLIKLEQQHNDGTQIAILIMPSLYGQSVESYANQVFEQWRLERVKKDNGVLLLIALNDRQLRIEVGYGLEGVLTDLRSHQIIEQYLVPNFRKQQYFQGIHSAIDAINTMIIDPNNPFLEEIDIADRIYGELVYRVALSAVIIILLFYLFNLVKPLKQKRWLQIYLSVTIVLIFGFYGYSYALGYYHYIQPIKSLLFVAIMYIALSAIILIFSIILQLLIGAPLSNILYKKLNAHEKVPEYGVFDRSTVIITLLVIFIFILVPLIIKFCLLLFGFIRFYIFMAKPASSGSGRHSGSSSRGGFRGGGGRSGGGGSSGRW